MISITGPRCLGADDDPSSRSLGVDMNPHPTAAIYTVKDIIIYKFLNIRLSGSLVTKVA